MILAIPQILQLIKEIITLIKSHPSATMQGVYMKDLKQLVRAYARDGANPDMMKALNDLRDQVRSAVNRD